MALFIHRSCRRTHDFKNWRSKESYNKKSFDLKWQGARKTLLHYHLCAKRSPWFDTICLTETGLSDFHRMMVTLMTA